MFNWTVITNKNREKIRHWVSTAPLYTEIAFRKPKKRSLEQNDFMWPWLRRISKTVEWAGELRTPEAWKDLFTAALREYEIVPGLEGGIVQIGLHTSNLTKDEMSALLDYIIVFAREHGVELDGVEDYQASPQRRNKDEKGEKD